MTRRRLLVEHLVAAAIAAACMMLLAGQALAAEVAPAAPGIDWPAILPGLVSVAVTILGTVFGVIWRVDARRKFAEDVFLSCVRIAFFTMNEIKSYTKTTVDDQIAGALAILQAELEKRGAGGLLTDQRVAQAKGLFKALNGEEKTQQKNLVRALETLSKQDEGAAAPLDPSKPLAGL